MLRNYEITASLWGGDKIVKETVDANSPKQAKQRGRDKIHKTTRTPYNMIEIRTVEIKRTEE